MLCARLANAALLAARLPPPNLRRVLDGFMKLATREVERYGGVVQRLDDSGLVALFGVPVAQEDHAARALNAALGIRDALVADRARDPRGRELALVVSAGLDSGPLIVRRAHGAWTLGEDEAGPLERAVRLQRAAAGGTVQVAEATWRAAGSGFVGRPVGPIAKDGHGEPLQAYELLRAAGPRRRDTRMPLVGRAAELAELRATWTQARSGQGRVVSLVGEAGIGKSRLLAELQRDLAAANARCLVGSCYAHTDAISYLPFREVLRVCFDIEEAAPSLARPRVVARLAALGLDAGAIAPYLFHVLGYAVDDPLFARLPVHLVRARAVEAVQAVLLAEATSRPLALVLEDFHWIDKGSEEIVGALVEALADRPVLLVLAYRPEYLHPWAHEPSHTTVSLGPLPRASAAALARAIPARAHAMRVAVGPLASADAETLARGVAGERGLSSALVRRVASQAGGNPLFVEERTRALLEGSSAAGESATPLDSPGDLALPPTVQDVILARADRLPSRLREVLQSAAVVGPTFSYPLLAAVAEGSAQVDEALFQLEDLDLIHTTRLTPERRYAFKHGLVQVVVYDTLPPNKVAADHGRIARALESLYADRLEEHYDLLAYHYERSADADRAVEYQALANCKAAAMGALAEAYQYFDTAMRRVEALPDTAANRHRRLALLVEQFPVMLGLGRLPEYYARLQPYRSHAAAASNRALLGAYYTCLAAAEWAAGALERGQASARRAAELCAAVDDAATAGIAYAMLARCELDLGRYDAALSAHQQALRAFDRRFHLRWYVWSWTAALWAHGYRGLWTEARAAGAAALQAGDEFGDRGAVSDTARDLALLRLQQGDPARALTYAQQAADTATSPVDRQIVAGVQALVACHLGQASAAPPILSALAAGLRDMGYSTPAIVTGVHLAEACRLAGDDEGARAALAEWGPLAAGCGMQYFAARARRLQAEMALDAAADPRTAARLFQEAIAMLEPLGAENELALTLLGYGRTLAHQGQDLAARAHLRRALAIFERLGTLGAPDRVRQALHDLPVTSAQIVQR